MATLLTNRDHEERPWGSFDRFTLNELSTVKILRVKPGHELSLQTHKRRAEFGRVLAGSGNVTIDTDIHTIQECDEFEIPPGVQHRVTAGADGLTYLEIALGDFDETDEIRLEDDYHRASPGA